MTDTLTEIRRPAPVQEIELGWGRMWQQDPDPWWTLQDQASMVATIKLETTRRRHEDYSGDKQWRVVTRHVVTVQVFVRGMGVFLRGYVFWGGERKALRRIASIYRAGGLYRDAQLQLENSCREAGVSEWRIMEAQYMLGERQDLEAERARCNALAKLYLDALHTQGVASLLGEERVACTR